MKIQLVPSRDMLTSGKRTKHSRNRFFIRKSFAAAAVQELCLVSFFFLSGSFRMIGRSRTTYKKGQSYGMGKMVLGFCFFFCCHSSSSMTYTLPAKQKFLYYPQYAVICFLCFEFLFYFGMSKECSSMSTSSSAYVTLASYHKKLGFIGYFMC